MLSDDFKNQEITQLFAELKKAPEPEKDRIVSNVCHAFEKSSDYSDAIIQRALKGII